MAGVEQSVDMPHGIQSAAVRAISVLLGLQVGLEYRFEHQYCCRFRDAIFYRGNSERALTASGLVDHYPAYGLRLIRSAFQFLRQFVQPSPHPVLLDVLKLLVVYSCRALVGFAAVIGECQNVLPIHLVVQSIEAKTRRSLRFLVQRRLQLPNTWWSC